MLSRSAFLRFGVIAFVAMVAALPRAMAENPYPFVIKGVRGTVVDATTSKPVTGVHVVATWVEHKGQFHGTSHECARVSTAVTGDDGRFALEGPIHSVIDNPLGMSSYLRIYSAGRQEVARDQWARENIRSGRDVENEVTIPLRPVASTRAQRLQYLLELTKPPIECAQEAASDAGVRSFLKAAAAEAKAIATAGWEQAAARVIARRAAKPEATSFDDLRAEWRILGSTTYAPAEADLEKDESHAMFLKAIHDMDAEKVRAAIAQGADVNRAGWREKTVLTVALDEYYLALDEAPAEVKPRWEIVRILLAAPGLDPDRAGAGQNTPLMLALVHERIEAVSALLDAGANPNLVVGESAVMFAVRQHAARTAENAQRVEPIFRLLIRHPRTDVNAVGRASSRPLCEALFTPRTQTIDILLDAGADPNVDCAGRPALMFLISFPPAMTRPDYLASVSTLAKSPRIKPETLDAAIRYASEGYGRNAGVREAIERGVPSR